MKEGENVLRILEETKKAIEAKDTLKIKQLSNQTNNTASRTQDPDNIAVAVFIYSLGKILEREQYREYPGWNDFYKRVILAIKSSITALKKDDEKEFKEDLGLIRKAITKLSGKLKVYIKDVFRKASINKASRIYEHGISMEKTAKILGISVWELAEYAGKTGIGDVNLGITLPLNQRIKQAEENFR